MLHVILTTIQNPTPSVLRLAQFLAGIESRLIIVGDTKGPDSFELGSVDAFQPARLEFLDIAAQVSAGYELANILPTSHYCRKNIGYLHAIKAGASLIYETDDDNAPMDHWGPREQWVDRPRFVRSSETEAVPRWVNVYRLFTDELIWPRGLPLDRIHDGLTETDVPDASLDRSLGEFDKYWAPIQQGLANGAPDVDAAWRLILDRDFDFCAGESVMLSPGQWCPFNTQTTWWWPDVYPLLYIPSYCSFRMCDIWKSFIAQRCLWELGTGVVFHAAEVIQERNPHSLMRDFADEVPGYLENQRIAEHLEALSLDSAVNSVSSNLRACYESLVAKGIFPEKELALVDAWIEDVSEANSQARQEVQVG